MAHKIETAEEALRMLEAGCKLTISNGKFFVTSPGTGEPPTYLSAAIRNEMKEMRPDIFEQVGRKEEKGPEEKRETEQLTIATSEVSAIAPSTLIPEDFILSQQSKALIYGIIVNEGITKIAKETKAPQITAKGTIDESGKEIAVSLADQAVRRLIEYYHRYKKVSEEIAMLQYEKGMLFESGQIQQEKIRGLEEVIFVSSLTRR